MQVSSDECCKYECNLTDPKQEFVKLDMFYMSDYMANRIANAIVYIPRIMNIIWTLWCITLVWYLCMLPISFRILSMALGYAYHSPSASKGNLKEPHVSSGSYDVMKPEQRHLCVLFYGMYCRCKIKNLGEQRIQFIYHSLCIRQQPG